MWPGSLPAKDVEVKVTLSPELKFASAKAPAKEQIAGQTILFGKVDLQPQQTIEYSIEAEGVKAGDARCRMEISSPILDPQNGPVVEEEPTRVLPAAGPPPPPPPPPME